MRAARRAVLLSCLAGAATGGCGHTRTVEPATAPVTSQPAKSPARAEGDRSFVSHHPVDPSRRGSQASDAVEVTTSPAALLSPGGAQTIQERLVRSGDLEGPPTGKLDAATREALERFQRAHELAATGVPDDATVSKLGLKTADVFRATKK